MIPLFLSPIMTSLEQASQMSIASSREKRTSARIDTLNFINYILLDDDKKIIDHGKGRILNLSQNGALLETGKPLYGSFVILTAIDLAGKKIKVKGRIANTRETDNTGLKLTGIKFVGSKEQQLNAIVTFVKIHNYYKYAAKSIDFTNGASTSSKIFVESGNTATITCSRCNKTKQTDVSRFKGHMTVSIKCPCGSTSKIQLEYRRQYRKKTELQGIYKVRTQDEKPAMSGVMTLIDLSRNGVRVKFKDLPPSLDIGDFLNIRFNLDDGNQTLVDREVVVRNINLPYMGGMFHRSSDTDNAIGFYLLN
jgi:hypothetical protein